MRRFLFIWGFWLLIGQANTHAAEQLSVSVYDQDLQVSRYPAKGSQLMIWVMPRVSATPRLNTLAEAVARKGIEVWLVDLADSLFLPDGPATQRTIQGRYVSGLVIAAQQKTAKTITLMARGYAAIPVLKGARDWQQLQLQGKSQAGSLSGVVLVSPELYATIPPLGMEPVYETIVAATNIPIMLYQEERRGNRAQLEKLLVELQRGGAQVFHKILSGVTGLFNDKDREAATLKALNDFPLQLSRSVQLLQRIPVPAQVAALPEEQKAGGLGLDTRLTPFRAALQPVALDLLNAQGQRVVREDYRGRVTVMNFWASWCPPCVEEIPSLNHLRELMADQPFELLSINYAEDRQRMLKFLQDVKVDFPVLLDSDGGFSAKWNVLVFPSTFVIAPDGRIVYGVNGAIHWDSPEVVAQLRALTGQEHL